MLSVVIPTMNRPDRLIKLVSSLQLQNFSVDSVDVLVVYNTKLDLDGSPVRDSQYLKRLCAPRPGVNHARNFGAVHARGDLILFLDDDCEAVDSTFLQRHCDYHQAHPELMALGGPYRLREGASISDKIYQQNNLNWIEANRIGNSRSTALLGGNASYKASIFKKGFRFTEEITYGGSETPLNTILALKYGPHGYFSNLEVLHNTQLNFQGLWRKAYLQGRGAALQNALYGHPLRHVPHFGAETSALLRAGADFYGLFFAVGFQSLSSRQNIFIIFMRAFFDRYIAKKTVHGINFISNRITDLYWWQYANIRHPMLVYPTRVFWFTAKIYWVCYPLLMQTLQRLRLMPLNFYWLIYPIFMQTLGFFISLGEPLPAGPQTAFVKRFTDRFLHVVKKIGWLFFKTVGLR